MVEEKTPLIFLRGRYDLIMSANGKLIRNIIIAVLVIAILGGAYYFVLKWEPEKEEIAEEEKETTYIISESAENVESVHIKNLNAEYDIIVSTDADGELTYYIPDLDEKKVSTAKIEGAVNSLIKMSVTNTISKDMSKMTEFGLDYSNICYTVKKNNGSSITVILGDETPTCGEFYCMVQGKDGIYTISSYKAAFVMAVPDDYRITSLMKLSDATEVKNFSLSKNGMPVMTVRATTDDEQRPGNLMFGTWKFIYPWEEDVDTEKFAAALRNLLVIEAIGFGEEGVSPAFDYEVELSTVERNYKFSIGGATPNGGVYLHDGKNLYIVDSVVRSTIEIMTPNEYLVKLVALAYMDDVSSVVIKCDAVEYVMETGDEDDSPYAICGKEVAENEFKKIYQTLVGILYTERIEANISGAPYLTVTYNYKDGRYESVKYYEYDERNMIAVRPDGTTVKVLQSEIDKIVDLIF